MVSTTRPCELLHIDLCGLMHVRSISGKSYILVTLDDFSTFTWVDFLKENGEALKPSQKIVKRSKHC